MTLKEKTDVNHGIIGPLLEFCYTWAGVLDRTLRTLYTSAHIFHMHQSGQTKWGLNILSDTLKELETKG